jgi:hypothetical protein
MKAYEFPEIPYYIVFSRYTNQLQTFQLVGGHYEPMNLTKWRLLMPEINLSLGLWQGSVHFEILKGCG